ncbi:MAG TPA: hypothetical protein V6D28_19730 [Leptolyngbyaceae cyanobacterium]
MEMVAEVILTTSEQNGNLENSYSLGANHYMISIFKLKGITPCRGIAKFGLASPLLGIPS